MNSNECSRCEATNKTTIRRLRDTIHCPLSNAQFDEFVEYIRRNKTTADKARAVFKYEAIELVPYDGKMLCAHCLDRVKAEALKNRKKQQPDNTNVGKLF